MQQFPKEPNKSEYESETSLVQAIVHSVWQRDNALDDSNVLHFALISFSK